MMGYTNDEQIASGIHFWLRAREVIVAEQRQGNSVVFVNLDACMGSQIVTIKELERLKARYTNRTLRRMETFTQKNVAISGIDTQAVPGRYLQCVVYIVTYLGSVRQSFYVLVDGIEKTIIQAEENLLPGSFLVNKAFVFPQPQNHTYCIVFTPIASFVFPQCSNPFQISVPSEFTTMAGRRLRDAVIGILTSGDLRGSIKTEVPLNSTFNRGNTVAVTFWSACPRNDLLTEGTFALAEILPRDIKTWVPAYDDDDFCFKFKSSRPAKLSPQSYATIKWRIPESASFGVYRISHFGASKSLFGSFRHFTRFF
ncbi:hypothetical protein C1H46_008834 [Malus baccata]|uniref:Neutral ceramidase n=1 Tax=Malus baccata TaxID=106549 RepID=A0A540N3E9_MALBA|nr:hypothetical protein C1H46_008834 [Malus baccata]